jgi:hypothetical protein
MVDSEYISEIIIIDNDVIKRPGIFESTNTSPAILNHDKIKIFPQKTNIGVNPAWNIGVKLSENDYVCIVNDDVRFDLSVLSVLTNFLTEKSGVVGVCPGAPEFQQPAITDGSIDIIPWNGHHTFGFGSLMFIHKAWWIPIPDNLIIYYGDNWIFDTCLRRGRQNFLITNMNFFTPWAQTTKDQSLTQGLLDKEGPIYMLELEKFTNNL